MNRYVWGKVMKHYHYSPTFNAQEFGAAERRADKYWQRRKSQNIKTSGEEGRLPKEKIKKI